MQINAARIVAVLLLAIGATRATLAAAAERPRAGSVMPADGDSAANQPSDDDGQGAASPAQYEQAPTSTVSESRGMESIPAPESSGATGDGGPNDSQPGYQGNQGGGWRPGMFMQGQNQYQPMFPVMHGMMEDSWDAWQTKPLLVNSSSWWEPNRFYTVADAMAIFHPLAKRSFPLFIDATDDREFDVHKLDLGVVAAERIRLGYWVCRTPDGWDHTIEAIYMGPENWHREFDFVGRVPGSVFTLLDTGLGGFNGADAAFIYYKSIYDSGEVEYRFTRHWPERDKVVYDEDGVWKQEGEDGRIFTFTLGLRNDVLEERLNLMTRRAGTARSTFGGDDDIRTINDLVGISFGGEYEWRHDGFYLGIKGKSTPALNFASSRDELNFDDAVLGSGARSTNFVRTTAGAISEMSLYAGWQIRPRVDLHVSYDFHWLTSLALAPQQVNLSSDPTKNSVYAGSDIFFNGMSLGVDVHW